jgi:hypothetical protein
MTRRRRRRYDDTLPTARTTLRTGYVRVLVFCNSCRHQADGAIAGRAQLSTDPYPALWSATQIMREGLAFTPVSATRKVAECPEYRHVVPGYPPLRDLSVLDAEHCPEIK